MITMRLKSWLHGQLVAKDHLGNRYYRKKNYRGHWKNEPRWVLYAGMAHATKVPPLWYGWLHHMTEFPETATKMAYPWQKPHRPNLTGTPYAFHPARTPSIAKKSYPYQAWHPPQTPAIDDHEI
ncbi:NADH-ubiquinone oxidoreductase subunit NDUFA12 family protein [Candidatus Hepatobacter penaei]|uniref:NADH-ubiquinone oxidoreductase subunit NDUFA12 family protein n=1 Tax=Candidatus Hepatobacter penaei TaxID=1274402 RepID=UPI000695BE9C|nr:NADH-ubiquinone oxidoreductase subunit NDUFA12 family protein [Candidatus Hepatobacter penaei]TGW15448.1 NADH:ubiquinone oxidoreductase subunit NDUFA12 [bacterium NHP-B]